VRIIRLENKSGTLGLLVTTVNGCISPNMSARNKRDLSGHTQARSACIASEVAASWPCSRCIRDAARPSLWSWPSCGRQALSDHRNQTAFCRNVSFPWTRSQSLLFTRTISTVWEIDIGWKWVRISRNAQQNFYPPMQIASSNPPRHLFSGWNFPKLTLVQL
jgi:hypothetical protein